ncbi:MAG: hypothetical protein LBS90_08275 [Oscillospiraceae bacterium]|nr:hypothetical protein [Oscillospiraceae bacterium]
MFYSILFPTRDTYDVPKSPPEPEFFRDLNLDQVFSPIIKAKPYLSLGDYFYSKPESRIVSEFRQEIAAELDSDAELREKFAEFSDAVLDCAIKMEDYAQLLTVAELKPEDRWRAGYLTRGELLNCAEKYMRAVDTLAGYLSSRENKSAGLREFREYVVGFAGRGGYREFSERIVRIRAGLSDVRYNMRIKPSQVRVRKFDGEINRGEEVLNLFRKF